MSTLQTFRFFLERDKEIPRFKRLQWEVVDVPIADVLLHGVHPWMGPGQHASLAQAFAEHMNSDTAKVGNLVPFGHSHDIVAENSYVWQNTCPFQRLLTSLRDNVYFVDRLTYGAILEIAKERLRDNWSHDLAKTLTEKAHPGFQELRRFLKDKDKAVKLSSYEDIDGYNLGRILSLDDFAQHDKLFISEGIPTPNFRLSTALRQFSDGHGRLQLVTDVNAFSLAVITKSDKPNICGTHVLWHVTRSGRMLTFRPDLGNSFVKRQAAVEFANYWRTDGGKYVFQTSMDKVVEMVERSEGGLSFPSLNYTSVTNPPTPTAEVDASRVKAFHIGKSPTTACTGDQLKVILREYGVSQTGNKDELVAKLAAVAANLYAKRRPELDDYFSANRYVRVETPPASTTSLPILEGLQYMRSLLLAMYVSRHLRGNAILEASHENRTYSLEELALALLSGRVSLAGAFLRVA